MTTAKFEFNLMRVFQSDKVPGSRTQAWRRTETVQFLSQPLERVFDLFADAH